MTQSTMRLTVNGKSCDVDAAPDTALLYVLRNDLALNGPKYGCGLGECGACAVLIDGEAARSPSPQPYFGPFRARSLRNT